MRTDKDFLTQCHIRTSEKGNFEVIVTKKMSVCPWGSDSLAEPLASFEVSWSIVSSLPSNVVDVIDLAENIDADIENSIDFHSEDQEERVRQSSLRIVNLKQEKADGAEWLRILKLLNSPLPSVGVIREIKGV